MKVWIKGKIPGDSGKKTFLNESEIVAGKRPAVEIYDHGRYFAMTGMRLSGLPETPQDRQPIIDDLFKLYFSEPKSKATEEKSSRLSVIERARKYIDTIPGAVSGSGGHNKTYQVACILILGFGLTKSEARILLSEYNRRCEPQWREKELDHKIDSADKEPGPRGYLRDAKDGDLPGITIPDYLERSGESIVAPPSWPVLAEEALYGLAGDIVRTIEPHSEADPAALLIQLLAGIGIAIGRNPFFEAEADRHRMNLYAVLVGSSSKSRKGTSWGHVSRLLREVEPDWNKLETSGLSSGEGLIWAVRNPIEKQEPIREGKSVTGYQTIITDHGIADKRLLVQEAEFASTLRVLSRDGNTLSAVIRDAWDKDVLRIKTKNSPAEATDTHIGIVAHITADELRQYLSRTEAGNGFANRFLFICVSRSKSLPEGGNLNPHDLVLLRERLAKALAFAKTTGQMRRDEDARNIWCAVYDDLAEGKLGLFGAITARAEAQVLRLSCLYALLDESPIVRKPHLLAALALWDYALDSARFIFSDALGNSTADEILTALRSTPDGMTRTEIRDFFGRNRRVDEITRALTMLAEHGMASFQMESDTGGRSAERWRAMSTTYTTETSKASPSVVNVVGRS